MLPSFFLPLSFTFASSTAFVSYVYSILLTDRFPWHSDVLRVHPRRANCMTYERGLMIDSCQDGHSDNWTIFPYAKRYQLKH
ncbi:hypothetical protein BKA57DRAFT_459584, partial [Linnemannia elongata]